MIIWGMRFYGWCDAVEGHGVEGRGQVATRFLHIMFVPLIPLGSYFMVSDDRGAPIGLSFKSIFVAWSRAAAFWGFLALTASTVLSGMGGLGAVSTGRPGPIVTALASTGCSGVSALVCLAVYIGVRLLTRTASARRADAILAQL